MKSADDWVNDAMQRIQSSWHTHYRSEMIGELEAAVAAFDKALALQPDHFDALYGVAGGYGQPASSLLMYAARLSP